MSKINLFVNIYKDNRPDRRAEIEFCLKKNIDNIHVDSIVVICSATDRAYVDTISRAKKLEHYHYQNKPTFNEYFKWSKPGEINIIANADIYFNETLAQIKTYDWSNNAKPFFALSRWDMEFKFNREIYQHQNSPDSQDAWIYYGNIPTIQGADFILGLPGTDNKIAYLMHNAGCSVMNPSKSVQAIHYHHTKSRTYSEKDKLEPPYLNVVPTELIINKKVLPEHNLKSRVMVPHNYECRSVKLVKDREAPTEWDLFNFNFVECNNEGYDSNIERDGYSQRWVEMKCSDKDCKAVKRVSLVAMSIL